jgi:hypothetical protein
LKRSIISVGIELNRPLWEIIKKNQTKRKYKLNTFKFWKKHYKCENGIKSTFVGCKHGRVDQMHAPVHPEIVVLFESDLK